MDDEEETMKRARKYDGSSHRFETLATVGNSGSTALPCAKRICNSPKRYLNEVTRFDTLVHLQT